MSTKLFIHFVLQQDEKGSSRLTKVMWHKVVIMLKMKSRLSENCQYHLRNQVTLNHPMSKSFTKLSPTNFSSSYFKFKLSLSLTLRKTTKEFSSPTFLISSSFLTKCHRFFLRLFIDGEEKRNKNLCARISWSKWVGKLQKH